MKNKCPCCKKNIKEEGLNYCRPCHNEKSRLSVMKSLKKNNYYREKTIEQRALRNIKRHTRYYFPLLGHNCEFCGKKAEEHHHNTEPIESDKFNYTCKECHNKITKGGK